MQGKGFVSLPVGGSPYQFPGVPIDLHATGIAAEEVGGSVAMKIMNNVKTNWDTAQKSPTDARVRLVIPDQWFESVLLPHPLSLTTVL